jgi:hypothetical protein
LEVLTISFVFVVVTGKGSRLKMSGMDDDVLFVHEYASPLNKGPRRVSSQKSVSVNHDGFMSIAIHRIVRMNSRKHDVG